MNTNHKKPSGSTKPPTTKPSIKSSSTSSTNEADKVPLLLYSTTGTNNLLVWKKEISVACEKAFGRLASIIDTNKVYVPKQVVLPTTPFTTENDPFGTKARKLLRRIDTREDLVQKLEEAQYPFSAYLWSKLSPTSQSVVKAYKFKALRTASSAPADSEDSDEEDPNDQAGSDGDNEDSDSESSVSSAGSANSTSAADIEAMPVTWRSYKKSHHHPLILWRLILATHTGSLTGSAPTDAINALRRYVNLRQRPDQSTDSYKEQVDNAIVGMACTILPKIPELLMAAMYIDNLDPGRYATLKSDLTNDETKGLSTRPRTLLAAHSMAIKRTNVLTRGSAHHDTSPTSVFLAATATPPTSRASHGVRTAGRNQQRPGRGTTRAPRAPTNGAKASPSATPAAPSGNCGLCHQPGHWTNKCPHLERASEAIKAKEPQVLKANMSFAATYPDLDAVVFHMRAFPTEAAIDLAVGGNVLPEHIDVNDDVPDLISECDSSCVPDLINESDSDRSDVPDLISESDSSADLQRALMGLSTASRNATHQFRVARRTGRVVLSTNGTNITGSWVSDSDSDSEATGARFARRFRRRAYACDDALPGYEAHRDAFASDSDLDAVIFASRSHSALVLSDDALVAEPTVLGALTATTVLLDSGASASLFFNSSLLTNIRPAAVPMNVTGISGTLRVTQIGDFGMFGEVYYSRDCNVNILATSISFRKETCAAALKNCATALRIMSRQGGDTFLEEVRFRYVIEEEKIQVKPEAVPIDLQYL